MKLIKEITETVNYITEDSDGKKVLHIEGIRYYHILNN